jgi:C4-dicarboxylate-binding protein DctP
MSKMKLTRMEDVMKKLTRTCAILAASVIAGSFGEQASAQTTLKFAWQLPLTNYASIGATQVAKCIQDRTAGGIQVETYPAGQLYRARQLYEAARNGAVDMAMFALGSLATTDPLADIVYLPFVVPSQDKMFSELHGELGKTLDGVAAKANLKILAYFAGSGGQFGVRDRALRTPADFNGLKIRVPGAVAAEVVKAFGGVPTTVDASEVYLALQRGTVDGTNFPLTSFYDRKLYETLKYLTLTNVSFDPDVVVISEKTWARLSADQQKAVTACTAEGEKSVRAEEQKLRLDYIAKLREKGMDVVELTPAQREAFGKAAASIVDTFVAKNGATAAKLVASMRGTK